MLSENLRRIRTEQRYTAPQLAKLADINAHTIYEIEAGRRKNPGVLIVMDLAKVLKVNINTLVK